MRERLARETDAFMEVLAEVAASADEEVEIGRTRRLAASLALAARCDERERRAIDIASAIVSLGKIPFLHILRTKSQLTPEEISAMHRFPRAAAEITERMPVLVEMGVPDLVLRAAEHMDGCGFPDGVTAGKIPRGARIMSICRAYVAMTSARPWRPALSRDVAFEEIRRCAGTQFDSEVVGLFMDMMDSAESPEPRLPPSGSEPVS